MASVFRTVLLEFRTCTFSLSCAVDPLSAVSICSQNVRVAVPADAGIATCWYSRSLCLDPLPSSHAFHDPACGGSAAELSITPAVADHGAADPVSNPGLPSNWPAVQPPPPPPLAKPAAPLGVPRPVGPSQPAPAWHQTDGEQVPL